MKTVHIPLLLHRTLGIMVQGYKKVEELVPLTSIIVFYDPVIVLGCNTVPYDCNSNLIFLN